MENPKPPVCALLITPSYSTGSFKFGPVELMVGTSIRITIEENNISG
jgi:hypothetical protein